MATENIEAGSGSGGPLFAVDTETVGTNTVNHSLSKIEWGPEDSFTLVNTGTASLPIQGAAAENAAVAGNPLQVGGRHDSSARTLGNGDVGALALTASGHALVDTGTVTVTVGTGATDLGKAIDSVVGGTDTGVAMLAKHKEDQVHLVTADDDYDVLSLDSLGSLHVNGEAHHVFDEMDATTGWAALNTDTTTLTTTKKHVLGTDALSFNKVDGAANTVFGAIAKTITSVDLGAVSPHDLIQTSCFVSSIADIDYVFVRLGTDATNYNEWRISSANLVAGVFETLAFLIGDPDHAGITGNGWDSSAITYIVVGCAFNAQSDTLSGIIFDQISYHTNQHTSAQLNSEVSSSVSSPNVKINGYSGSVDTNAGTVSANTLRVVLASDSNFIQTEDATHGSGDAGVMALAVRNDALAALAGTDGDYAPVQVNEEGAVYVQSVGGPGNGLTKYRNVDVDETEDQVSASAVTLYTISAQSIDATPVYLHFYDATAASVTVGTTTPDLTFIIPTQGDGNGAGLVLDIGKGWNFSTALTIAATTTVGGSTGPGANEVIVNLGYK